MALNGQAAKSLEVLASIFVGSSVSGWAKLIWQNKPLTIKQKVAGTILSGFCGTIVALLLWESMENNMARLVGISILSGIGGASTLEWLTDIVAKRAKKLLDDPNEPK